MNDESRIDEILEKKVAEALAGLESGDVEVSSAARPYLETLGALPWGLEPLEPSPDVKRTLMTLVAEERPADGGVDSPPIAAAAGPGWRSWLAAAVVVALLGVAGLQTFRLAEQRRVLDEQAARIVELEDDLETALPAADRLPAWMASSGTELCALRPQEAADDGSKGWLFVRQDHQHWYVAVEGLSPAPSGHVYELWFQVDGELVSGGTFEPGADGRATLTSETMPNPVTGIAVTLEADAGDGVPSETTVLYGDEVMLVL